MKFNSRPIPAIQACIIYTRFERHLSAVSVHRRIAAPRAISHFIQIPGRHRRMVAGDFTTYRVYLRKTRPSCNRSPRREQRKAGEPINPLLILSFVLFVPFVVKSWQLTPELETNNCTTRRE